MTEHDRPTRTLRLRPDRTAPLEALLVGAGAHLDPVLDVGSTVNGDVLVELPAARTSLIALLAGGDRLRPGEAVTVLIPLAEALDRLHASGVAHGAAAIGAVLFDDAGSPRWAAPEQPVLARTASEGDFAAAVAADDQGFALLAAGLLDGADVSAPQGRPTAESLFALADPEPVRLERPRDPLPWRSDAPQRLVAPAPPAPSSPGPQRIRGPVATAAAVLGTVRIRVWAAFAAVAVLLVAVVTLLPGDRGDADAAARRPPTTTASAPVPASRRVDATVAAAAAPAAAVRALLAARARLLAEGDEAGLDRVDAPGSPVLHADRVAVRSGADPVRVGAGPVVIRSAAGGTALADVGGVTVLAVRQQDGWRLRDVVAPPQPGN